MNNAGLAETLAADHGVTKADAKKIVDGLFAAIGDAAARGEEISINAFGKFKVKRSPERDGRNPSTGEKISIKASKKLAFQPARRSGTSSPADRLPSPRSSRHPRHRVSALDL